jgi:hypothetical protein
MQFSYDKWIDYLFAPPGKQVTKYPAKVRLFDLDQYHAKDRLEVMMN